MHTAISAKNSPKKTTAVARSSFFRSVLAGLVLVLAVFACTAAEARWIRVGILAAQSASLSGPGLSIEASGRRAQAPSSFTASARGSSVVIGGRSYTSPVIVRSSSNVIKCGQYSYEGEIVLKAAGGSLTAVNRLDVEKYLRGVLGYEVNPNWHLEALKAQAVISRTYALAQMGRHNSQGYDVCTADHCQVYKGTTVHNANTDRAIVQTKGRVLMYNGSLAQTFFCSDNGGASSDVRDVWGKPIPYLIVRKEPYPSGSPKANWQTTLSTVAIQNALAKKGKGVGSLRSMTISSRDAAGRPVQLTFNGSAGSVTLPSAQFRTLIGPREVRSTFFEFSPDAVSKDFSVASSSASSPRPKKSAPAPKLRAKKASAKAGRALTSEEQDQLNSLIDQKVFTVDERIDMIAHPEHRLYYLERVLGPQEEKPAGTASVKSKKKGRKAAPQAAVAEAQTPATEPETVQEKPKTADRSRAGRVTADLTGGSVTLYGTGWGHGVGLSQWGAKAMAEHGWSVEKILDYYYPGTRIVVNNS